MREIKFRAWDEDNKQMISGNYLDSDGYSLNNIFKNKEWIFMQFTGLLDKNKKEIYEGDILKRDYTGEAIIPLYYVAYYRTGFVAVTSTEKKRTRKIIGRNYLFLTEDNFEIIGNIYENPELLTKKDKEER